MARYPLEHLINALAPTRCLICYQEAESLCINCRQVIPELSSVCCILCNKVVYSGLICGACQRKHHINEVYCIGSYDTKLKQLIREYKFNGKRSLSAPFAKLLDERLPYFNEDVVVAFVPTISPHIRERGFDQAKRLAQEFAKIRKLKLTNTLNRLKSQQQRGKSKAQRQAQAGSAFAVRKNVNLQDKTVIIIDDVMTTGATLKATAKQLHIAGAKTIVVAVLAQVKLQN